MPMLRSNAPVETVRYLESVIPQRRLDYLTDKCASILSRSPGNVVEVGVYRGGSLLRLANALKTVCPEFHVFAIDTFSGHPYTDGHPVHPVGKYGDVNPDELRRLLEQHELDRWVTLIEGRIEDVWLDLHASNIAFAHVDCDLYIPVKYAAEVLPASLRPGGMIYFDDYGHEHCPGATRAVDEVLGGKVLTEVEIQEDGTCWSCYLDF